MILNFVEKIKQIYAVQDKHNHAVDLNLKELQKIFPKVQDHQQLLFRLKYWQGQQHLKYDNVIFFIYFGLALLSLLPVFIIHPSFLIMTFLFLVLGVPRIRIENALNDFKESTKHFYIQHKYSLREHQNEGKNPVFPRDSFPLFNLGDQRNELKNIQYGEWQLNEKNYPFMLFRYLYVIRKTKKNHTGKLETTHEHLQLFGIMLKNFPARGVSISTHQKKNCRLGIKWSSGDIQFDNHYQLSGFSEIWLAKFFKPNHILHLESALQDYQGDFYVEPQNCTLCWLFSEDILHIENWNGDDSTVAAFAEQLESLSMPHFEKFSAKLQKLILELE